MRLFLYRISLTEADYGLFESAHKKLSRRDFLLKNFGKSFGFEYWGEKSVRYEVTQIDDEVIAGAVCRWRSETAEADPENPFASVEGGKWFRSAFFFNIEDHEQVFAIEHNQMVGSPSAILGGLARAVNDETDGDPYFIETAEINIKGSFRDAISMYPGKITTLQFRLVVPNPPDVEKETREALKKLGRQTGAEEVIETLKSTKGLKTDSDYIRDAVDYVEDGGGDVLAKDGVEPIYDSKKLVKTITVEDEIAPTGTPVSGLASLVKRMLRR